VQCERAYNRNNLFERQQVLAVFIATTVRRDTVDAAQVAAFRHRNAQILHYSPEPVAQAFLHHALSLYGTPPEAVFSTTVRQVSQTVSAQSHIRIKRC